MTHDGRLVATNKRGQSVSIFDPKTGKAYQLDRNDLTISLADDPDGLAVVLDGEHDRRLHVVTCGSRHLHLQHGR